MSDPWWPEGTNEPAFQVQRTPYGTIVGGDYVRARSGGLDLPQTALRYNTQVKGWEDLRDRSLMAVRPINYDTMEIIWGWPKTLEGTWTEVALVRSSFGIPVTVNDGVTVYKKTHAQVTTTFSPDPDAENPSLNGPVLFDRPLNGGYWYYYTVFFKTGPLDWVPGYAASSPMPVNYHHSDHLWNHLPPWYQYTDEQQGYNGQLRRFLEVFGFELDLTREYVEQWQKLYHIDYTPMSLLRKLGENFNVPYESGLGDIRYRGLVGNIAKLYAERGTSKGLDHVIEAASQYRCETTTGDNIMLTPEDSEFLSGTGRWAAVHPDLEQTMLPWNTTPDVIEYHNTPQETMLLVADTSVTPPPPGEGRGVMEFYAAPGSGALANLAICCGCGIKMVPGPPLPPDELIGIPGGEWGSLSESVPIGYSAIETEILPVYGAIVVDKPGILYGFSVWIKMPTPHAVAVGVMWFGPKGGVEDFISYNEQDTPIAPTPADTWTNYTIQAAAPLVNGAVPPGRYLVPYIRVEGPGLAYGDKVFVAGAAVYEPAKGLTNAVPFAPDQYITLGDVNENLGELANPPTGTGGGLKIGQPGG